MTDNTSWQYRLSELRSPEPGVMQAHLDEWAAAGWELLSGSTVTMLFEKPGSHRWTGVVYSMWWRRPVGP
ncbi:hypothetical protein [Blastococcus xanthinilyticus]|uniref:hypothetical protein n=1 Tax=Blastococcus xanthinilyticus TaxID=1564164 RepID=UPI0014134AE8|nr:hypothetical protein [Blastococcus xanthinilyticus]